MEDAHAHVHALDYLSVFRRRKWWLVLPILASIVIGAVLVRFLPKQYKATATLGVIAPGVSPNLVGQSSPLDNAERMRAFSQQLLSAPMLARVAREERLASGVPDDGLIGRLRSSVAITVPDPLALTNEPRKFDTFMVSYSDEDPARAQRVTNRLSTVFVDETSKTREEQAGQTSAFIAAQLQSSQSRLSELEAKLRRAKESHIGRLPEQTQANLQTLSGLRQQLDANATALRGEQDRLSMTERQLQSLQQGAAQVLLIPRAGSPSGEVIAAAPETRIATLQRELAVARGTYTDKHPEIARLQEELAAARREAVAERQKPAADREVQLQADPAFRQLAADREMGRLRIRELQRAESDIRRQIGVYQARVESAPMVEQQLTSVQRDFDLEKQNYSDLSSKLRTATMAENVEHTRRGEQFTILYPASYPTEPTKPVPIRVMLMAIICGICAGAALTLGREYLDRSVHDVRDLRDELDVPVLGEVTRIQPA
jgi:polysaccharide chain length determinant protein (PEP-CTERM system associated)